MQNQRWGLRDRRSREMAQGHECEGFAPRNGIDVTHATACPKDTELFLFTTGPRPQPGGAVTCDILTMLRVLGCGWYLRTVSVLALRSLVTKPFLQHAFPELLLSTRLHGGDQGGSQQWGRGALTRDPVEPSS